MKYIYKYITNNNNNINKYIYKYIHGTATGRGAAQPFRTASVLLRNSSVLQLFRIATLFSTATESVHSLLHDLASMLQPVRTATVPYS